MFGMSLASEHLQKLLANRMRDLLAKLSENHMYGIAVGVGLTLMIQSSGAVTSMLVGLGSAGVVSLSQVMSVILGTTIGTTFTVQLLSFNIAQYGMPIFSFAFIIYFIAHKKALKHTMSVVMGFGLIFWGLELIGIGTHSLREAEFFIDFLGFLKENPLMAIIATSAFEITAILKVGKNNFSPPPKIDSMVLKIIKKNNLSKELIQTINKIFSYRRKTVKNILKQFNKESKIDKRVDDLSGEEIISLANQILEK